MAVVVAGEGFSMASAEWAEYQGDDRAHGSSPPVNYPLTGAEKSVLCFLYSWYLIQFVICCHLLICCSRYCGGADSFIFVAQLCTDKKFLSEYLRLY